MKNTKLVITLLLLVAVTASHAQSGKKIKGNGQLLTKTISVSEYDAVSSAGIFKVALVEGIEGSITLSAEENLHEYIDIYTEDNKLKIEVKKNYQLSTSIGKSIEVTVPVQQINGLSLAGSGSISSKQILNADDFKISLAGSGSIQVEINTKSTKTSVAGSGKINLSGNTERLKISVAGSGNTFAENLKADNVELSVAGSGNVTVYSSETIKASIAGSGNIEYHGNPEIKDIKVSGSGRVKGI